MDRPEADERLRSGELVPVFEAQAVQAKDLERQLLDSDIAATLAPLAAKECCSGAGCACRLKLQIMVRADDVPKVAKLMQESWLESLRHEDHIAPEDYEAELKQRLEPTPEGELRCPACGHAGPLAEGACADCGLVLE